MTTTQKEQNLKKSRLDMMSRRLFFSLYTEGSLFVETDDKIELITVINTIGQMFNMTKDKLLSINDLNAGIYIVLVKTDKSILIQKVFKE